MPYFGTVSSLKKNQNAPRPSQHPPVREEKCQNFCCSLLTVAVSVLPDCKKWKACIRRGGSLRNEKNPTCTTLCYSGLRPHPRLAPRAAAHPAQSGEIIIVEDTKTMFYVDVESAAVSAVRPTNARHHKMCVRVTIDCVPEKEIF